MQQGHVKEWVRQVKRYVDHSLLRFLVQRKREVSFAVPAKCSLFPPLPITDAASGASLSSFREVMDYGNLVASFSRTKECEAAGAVWMLDPICSDIDDITVGQLEGAMSAWSEEAYPLSSKHAPSRRLSFDVPLPALVVDVEVAQRLGPNMPGVCSTEALTMLAGRAVVTTRRAAMSEEALQQSSEDRAWHLFNAALSVPIRMRLLPDGDATHLAALTFSEKMFSACAASGAESSWRFAETACRLTGVENCFAKQEPASKLEAALKAHGLQFKGKARTAATAAALKSLRPFVLDGACNSALALAEVHFPELREPTLLMRIGFACSTRAVSDAKARELFVFSMNSFRGEKLSVGRAIGRDGKTPAMLHALFKMKELVEYIFHEASLMNKEAGGDMAAFKTPLHILQKFAAPGADGPTLFAPRVAEHRNTVDVKTKAMIDVARPLWSSAFDDEIAELAQQELQNSTTGFVRHTYLTETSQGVGAKRCAFVAACTAGCKSRLVGMSELGDEQKEELQKLQGQLRQLRRKTVKFVSLPSVGAASGAEYAVAQMQSLRGALSLGHRFGRKKNDVRAFILSAELFPPNVVKQGGKARMSEQMACDEAKQNDDILIFLDGRSRANRRVIESFETKLESGGSHAYVEASSYTKNNRETAIFSMPLKGPRKVVHRAESSACGESSTADASYSGIPMRRLPELPRMDHETKASILGVASCASVDGGHPRLQGDIDSKGRPFSHSEVKPLLLWQTLVEHHKVTHVVDFTPGSGASAVAAFGAMEYEGIAANDAHRDWLDSIVDRCAMYKAGHDEGYAEQLGGDAEFVEKAGKISAEP
ncbi:unnamed protein product [Prorocentrum cordatum]|uniref:Uncharacterized protein n=1 Tax=Prorocentrum cordatum TaxID=2364126 RepID=A0ABN9VT30_9DINO|nr:unnamed protein product [Polarella glacialis]